MSSFLTSPKLWDVPLPGSITIRASKQFTVFSAHPPSWPSHPSCITFSSLAYPRSIVAGQTQGSKMKNKFCN